VKLTSRFSGSVLLAVSVFGSGCATYSNTDWKRYASVRDADVPDTRTDLRLIEVDGRPVKRAEEFWTVYPSSAILEPGSHTLRITQGQSTTKKEFTMPVTVGAGVSYCLVLRDGAPVLIDEDECQLSNGSGIRVAAAPSNQGDKATIATSKERKAD
jgi:hypothetical protein